MSAGAEKTGTWVKGLGGGAPEILERPLQGSKRRRRGAALLAGEEGLRSGAAQGHGHRKSTSVIGTE